MRAVVMLVAVAGLWGCVDESIGPDPDASSSSGNSMQGGADAGGADAAGGSAPVGGEGGAPMAGLGYENGSRLHARVYKGSDGAKQFAGWRDSELGIDCTVQRTPGGAIRCLPSGSHQSASYFTSSTCATPVVLVDCDTAPSFAIETVSTDCQQGVIVHAVGPVVTNIYLKNGENCSPTTVPVGLTAYAVGAAIQGDTFVAMPIEVD